MRPSALTKRLTAATRCECHTQQPCSYRSLLALFLPLSLPPASLVPPFFTFLSSDDFPSVQGVSGQVVLFDEVKPEQSVTIRNLAVT